MYVLKLTAPGLQISAQILWGGGGKEVYIQQIESVSKGLLGRPLMGWPVYLFVTYTAPAVMILKFKASSLVMRKCSRVCQDSIHYVILLLKWHISKHTNRQDRHISFLLSFV